MHQVRHVVVGGRLSTLYSKNRREAKKKKEKKKEAKNRRVHNQLQNIVPNEFYEVSWRAGEDTSERSHRQSEMAVLVQ